MGKIDNLSIIVAIFVTLVNVTALILLFLLTIRVLRNLNFLQRIQHTQMKHTDYPRVSVLVPARNEADNISECLESLAQQDYTDYQIIVLDDQSIDNTLEHIQKFASTYPMIHPLIGESLPPPDWNGKSYACHRLSEKADGDWLLFTDADTVHTPQSIRRGIEQALHLDVDLLSVMPYQITKSWLEQILVSFIMNFLPLLGINLDDMWHGNGTHAIANGQYLLVRKSAYRAMGGHVAIQSALVDDFALANHFIVGKRRIAFVNGISMVACRMYHNAGDVWRGFSKNIVLSLQTSQQWSIGLVILFAWSFVCLFVLPYFIFILYPDKLLALIAISWLIGLRLMVGLVMRRPISEAFFTVFSAIGVMLLGLNAISLKLRKQNIIWKERSYPANQ